MTVIIDEPIKATELLTRMLRTEIAPELRALGLRGSGQNWSLPNRDDGYALLSFQRSVFSHASDARFTVNVRVTRHAEWTAAVAAKPWLGQRPTATTRGGPGWQARIGQLLDPAVDRWWTIRSANDVPSVAEDVVHLVRSVALRHLRAHLAGEAPPPPYPWPALATEG